MAALIVAALALALWGNPAVATTIATFTTSGSTSGGAVAGTGNFDVTGSVFEITLTNTTASIGDIAQVLDGLSFTANGAGLVLTGVTAAGFLDCSSGTCVSVGTFHDYHAGTDLVSPYA